MNILHLKEPLGSTDLLAADFNPSINQPTQLSENRRFGTFGFNKMERADGTQILRGCFLTADSNPPLPNRSNLTVLLGSRFLDFGQKSVHVFALSFIILLFASPIFSQKWTMFKKNDSIDCKVFTTDPLQNVYVVTGKNEVLKYDNQGYFDSRYANKKYGRLESVDATNAFKLLFWYPDFQSMMLVDASLNELKTMNTNDLGIGRVAAFAMGDDGNLWVLDGSNNQLIQFMVEQSSIRRVQSTPLSMTGLQPTAMVVRKNMFYLNVPSRGILVFDRFGKLNKTLNILNAASFQVLDNQVFYQKDGQYARFHLQTLATTPIALPEKVKGTQPLRMERNRLYVQRGPSVDIYETK